MSLDNFKITGYAQNVKELPDYPSDAGYTAKMLKEFFDGRGDNEIKEKFNALIDGLKTMFAEAEAGADEKVSGHNAAADAHGDIRGLISELSDRFGEYATKSETEAGTDEKVSEHNAAEDAHENIRSLISELEESDSEARLELLDHIETVEAELREHKESFDAHTDIRLYVSNLAKMIESYATKSEVEEMVNNAIANIPNGDEVSY